MKLFLKMALSAVAALGVVWVLIVFIQFLTGMFGVSEFNRQDAFAGATIVALFALVIFALPGVVCWFVSYSLLATSAFGPVRKLFISAGFAGVVCPLVILAVFGGIKDLTLQTAGPLTLLVVAVALLSAFCYWLLFMVLLRYKKTENP